MAIFRVEKNKDYSIIHNGFIKDARLSLKAKGLMSYFLSRPNDWSFYSNEILKHCKDGKDSLRSAINELQDVGYIDRDFKRSVDGQFSGGYNYIVYETPNPPKAEKPISDEPKAGKPNSENPPLLSTESSPSTELSPKTEISSSKEELPNRDVYTSYERCGFGLLNQFVVETLDADVKQYTKAWVIDAMKEAVKQNKYKLTYVEGILRNWKADGRNGTTKKEDSNASNKRDTKSEQDFGFHF